MGGCHIHICIDIYLVYIHIYAYTYMKNIHIYIYMYVNMYTPQNSCPVGPQGPPRGELRADVEALARHPWGRRRPGRLASSSSPGGA